MTVVQEAIIIYTMLGTVQGMLIMGLWMYRPNGPLNQKEKARG